MQVLKRILNKSLEEGCAEHVHKCKGKVRDFFINIWQGLRKEANCYINRRGIIYKFQMGFRKGDRIRGIFVRIETVTD
jgi:hypothetical protein